MINGFGWQWIWIGLIFGMISPQVEIPPQDPEPSGQTQPAPTTQPPGQTQEPSEPEPAEPTPSETPADQPLPGQSQEPAPSDPVPEDPTSGEKPAPQPTDPNQEPTPVDPVPTDPTSSEQPTGPNQEPTPPAGETPSPEAPPSLPAPTQDPGNATEPGPLPTTHPQMELKDPQLPTAPFADSGLSPSLAELPPIVTYDIAVTLLPEDKEITGQLRLVYVNHSPDIIPDLRFHTYLNAFKNSLSTYRTELMGLRQFPEKSQSFIHVSRAEVDGVDLTNSMAYHLGPDSAPGDQTVLRIPLQGPLMPGQSTEVVLDFRAKLPYAYERMGYVDNFFFLAQWYPKVGVWETRGARGADVSAWNCRPYHKNTEYYANFGNYRVAIEIPSDYEVGATGAMVKEETGVNGKVITFEQAMVHDFALVAAEDLTIDERLFDPAKSVTEAEYEEAMAQFGLSRDKVALKPVKMFFLYPSAQTPDVDRHFAALEIGLKEFGLRYGPYPYETITMLNPPKGARGSVGGMEYPTLITLGYSHRRAKSDYDIEELILHEFAHQYFYGLVATNEFEEAYLDEGFTTYISTKLTNEAYGGIPRWRSQFGRNWPISDWVGLRRMDQIDSYAYRIRNTGFEEPIAKPGWTYYSRWNYGLNSYSKPALVLEQLERELGQEVMARVMRTYVDRYSYSHPGLQDFQDLAEEVSGRELEWFFDGLFHNIGKVDYEAKPVRSYDLVLNDGYADGPDGPVLQDPEAEPEKRHRQVVSVVNNGSMEYPVEVAVHFDDGSIIEEAWDGSQRWKRFIYDDAAKITKVEVDPNYKVVMDPKRTNNTYITDPNPKWMNSMRDRLTLGFQHILQTIAWGF